MGKGIPARGRHAAALLNVMRPEDFLMFETADLGRFIVSDACSGCDVVVVDGHGSTAEWATAVPVREPILAECWDTLLDIRRAGSCHSPTTRGISDRSDARIQRGHQTRGHPVDRADV